MATTKRTSHKERKRSQARRSVRIARYESEAKEIAAAKQAMERLHKGVEFEPERLRYVTDLHSH